MSWTNERVELLKKLWGEGKTAAEIAKELGDVTRNAVIGKAHRLKLSNRASPIQQNTAKKAAPAKATVSKSTTAKVVVQTAMNDTGGGVSMAELKGKMCRWPIGDPREDDFHFCGGNSIAGLPYCEEHAKVAYQASSRNRVLKAKDFEDANTIVVKNNEEEKEAVA
jgi:GcrA cell cycle regulator